MKKPDFYIEMDRKEKIEWWVTLVGILCGLAGSCYLLYLFMFLLKKAILKQ